MLEPWIDAGPSLGRAPSFGPLFALLLTCCLLAAVGCGGSGAPDAGDGAAGEGTEADADYADRMAAEHAGETPTPSGAAAGADGAAVVGEEVVYGQVGDAELRGYLARPEGSEPGGPALLVIQEWWGLNDNIRAMARQFAAEGYTALAVDLYGGEVAETPERARELMSASMEREADLDENMRQAYRFLTEERAASAVGSVGWCFGGGWSLRTATLLPRELDAAVIYYGRVITDPEALRDLEVPVLGLFGAADEGIPVASVEQFEQVMKDLGKDVEIHIYEGADHAFANPSGGRYDEATAERAWAETTEFFARHLRGEGAESPDA